LTSYMIEAVILLDTRRRLFWTIANSHAYYFRVDVNKGYWCKLAM